MKVVLAEKPSVARDIAAFLRATSRHDGYLEGNGYQVTWALGHLVELKEPQDYDSALKRWSLGSLPIVPPRFELKLIDDGGARRQFAVIRNLFRSAGEIICATDAGREGELIFRYILEMTGATNKPLRRLWLSSLTEDAISSAFSRLRPASDYEPQHAAARCRSESDWIVGLNATRYFTVSHGASGHLWSVGRVQTPVLAMIVDRDDEIRTFRPEAFFELETRYRDVVFPLAGERFKNREEADSLCARVASHPFEVTKVEFKTERVPPPQLHDLTELQRDMNRRYAMSAADTLKAAQSLYEAKLITYPRTDSRYLTADMKADLPEIFRKLRPLRPTEIDRLTLDRLPFGPRIINDAKVRDHHALIPSGKVPGNLAPPDRKIFDAIMTRFIAAFYPQCEKQVTVVDGRADQVEFRTRGVRVSVPGWTELYPRKAEATKDEDQALPEFRVGEKGPHDPSVKRGETTPPKAFNENSLLGAMETAGRRVDDEALKEALKERGLGTPATRAAIIETLLKRGYIVRQQKALRATDVGRYLMALIHDRALKSAEMTGDWESRMRLIESGRLDRRRFMEDVVSYTTALVRTGGAVHVDPTRWGDCPLCKKPVIEGKRGHGCAGWRQGCPFVLWREYRGLTFSASQTRELLQCGVAKETVQLDGGGPVILRMIATGAITEVPVPAAASRQQRTPAAGAGVRGPKRTSPSKARSTGQTGAGRIVPGQGERPRTVRATKARVEADAPVSLGACPRCQSPVVEREKAYGCSAWKSGCSFAVWRTMAGKKISARTAKLLLTRGQTPVMKGFKSRAGKSFDAALKLEASEVKFVFSPEG